MFESVIVLIILVISLIFGMIIYMKTATNILDQSPSDYDYFFAGKQKVEVWKMINDDIFTKYYSNDSLSEKGERLLLV